MFLAPQLPYELEPDERPDAVPEDGEGRVEERFEFRR
jgi:hypothetical protein